MKKILKVLTLATIIGGAAAVGAGAHAWAKDHFQGDILQSTAAVFNITDRNVADAEANIDLMRIISDLEDSVKDIKSQEVEKQLKRLRRRWEEDHKRLKDAVKLRRQMISRLEKRQTVRML